MASPRIFQSKRLMYRAVEDTPEDEDLIHSIQVDSEGFANSSVYLIKPQARRDTMKGYKKYLAEEALIGVIICLVPEGSAAPTSTAPADNVAESGHGDGKPPAKPAEKAPTPIGIMSLTNSEHRHHRESYITLNIAAPHQRKGYGSEAIGWILQWGFQIAGLHRIGIESLSYNEGATRLYRKLGFTPEGRTRESIWFDGGWHDIMRFGMLDREWRERPGKAALPSR